MQRLIISLLALLTVKAYANPYIPIHNVSVNDLVQIKAQYQVKMANEWDANAFCEAESIDVNLRLELSSENLELTVVSTSIVKCKNQNRSIKWDSCEIRYTHNGPELYYCDN